jgi:glycosyltransferase involved in cell wall biosynthesis
VGVAPAIEVSVVIPTRDRAGHCGRALASALAQRDVQFEAIVVDDGSVDQTGRCLAGIEDSRVRISTLSPSQGVARARNVAIERAQGDWLAFLDDDDVWAPDKLRSQLDAARDGTALVYAPAVVVDERDRVKRVTTPARPEQLSRALLETNTVGTPSGVLARTRLVRDVGGFDEQLSIFADWDLWLGLLEKGPAASVDHPLIGYLEHSGNMHLTQIGVARQELRYLARKHRHLCEVQGVRFGSITLSRWLVGQYRRQGRRMDAAREYSTIGLRCRSARDLGRAFGVLLGEHSLRLGRMAFGEDRSREVEEGLAGPVVTPTWLPDALAGNAFARPSEGESRAP